MSNQLMQQDYPADDGWGDTADEASSRMIRGQLLKFADWNWRVGKEGAPFDTKARLLAALATSAAWIRWESGKPVETRIRRPGERMPEREDLGYTDEEDWEFGPGGDKQDPWANTRLVFFADETTAEAFTFSTSSYGGRDAVIALGDAIARMRRVHPDAVPIVELQAQEMVTKYGRKSKPYFKITGWKSASPESSDANAPSPRAPSRSRRSSSASCRRKRSSAPSG